MSGASVELRWGRLNWAGDGSEAGAKRGVWSTSKGEVTRSSNATTGRVTAKSIS